MQSIDMDEMDAKDSNVNQPNVGGPWKGQCPYFFRQ